MGHLVSSSFSIVTFSRGAVPIRHDPVYLIFDGTMYPSFETVTITNPNGGSTRVYPSSGVVDLGKVLFVSNLFASPKYERTHFVASSITCSAGMLPRARVFFPFGSSKFLALLFLLTVELELPSISVAEHGQLPFTYGEITPK